jgi:serine protease AprX
MGRGLLLAALGAALFAAAPAQAAPVQADLDGDGVYDDLEASVRRATADSELRVIVSLSDDASRERVRRLEAQVDTLDSHGRFTIVDAFAATVAAGEVRELAAAGGVVHVERDAPVRAFNSSAQSAFGVTAARTALPDLDGDADGQSSYSTGDLVAAVIDTGIDANHVDLDGGKVLAFQDFTEATFDAALDTAYDDEGHGTHVAGTIAGDGDGGADGRGVAPRAALVGLKVLDANGNGSTSDVIAALNWAVANPGYGIDVINMSLGSEGCSNGTGAEPAAVNAAVAAGIVVAVAAGNEGPGRCTIGSPGATESALTVGAMADPGAGGFYMADFSSRGRTADGRTKPDVVAPGVRIRSAAAGTGNGYSTASGTSMATPFVAGVVLLLRDQSPSLTATQVKQRITSTALDWGRGGDETLPGSAGLDIDHGHGRLDAHAALVAAGAPLGAGPPVPIHRLLSSRLSGTGAFETYTLIADGSGQPLAVTLTLADDDLNGNGLTDADANGNHLVDFDMRLSDAGGNVVKVFNRQGTELTGATTGVRQDAFYRPPETPTPYTLRVESFARSGDFLLDVSGGTIVPAGATSAPVASAPPTITGTAVAGQTLTATPGTWNAPVTTRYAWLRCDTTGTQCSETGVTGAAYPVRPADGGQRLKVVAVAASGIGEASADSALTGAVPVVAPTVGTAPSLSGAAIVGRTLTATAGVWNGTPPLTRGYAWQRCEASGANCVPIAGAAAKTYVIAAADLGSALRVVETVTNAAGGQSAASLATGQVLATATAAAAEPADDPEPQPDPEPALEDTSPAAVTDPPSPTALPAVSGATLEGRVLSADPGIWNGRAPVTFAFQWERCDATGTGCVPSPEATDSSYRLRASDVGARLRMVVTGENADGRVAVASAVTEIVERSRPHELALPRVMGDARAGRRLAGFGGAWWGSRPLRFRVEWLRCDSGGEACRAIPGADRAGYQPAAADLGHRLRLRVIAANGAGRRRVKSAPTGVVRAFGTRSVRSSRLPLRLAAHPDASPLAVSVSLRA